MSEDFHIHFQFNYQAYDVDLNEEWRQPSESIYLAGRHYSLHGSAKAVEIVRDCLEHLSKEAIVDLKQATTELNEKLQQLGASEIAISLVQKVHALGIDVLKTAEFDSNRIITKVCDLLETHYVYPKIAHECVKYIHKQHEEGAYDLIRDPYVLAATITADLRLISDDKHLDVGYFPKSLQAQSAGQAPELYPQPNLTQTFSYKSKWDHPSRSYEFKSGVLVDSPGVGYLDIRTFNDCCEDGIFKKIERAVKHIERLEKQRGQAKTGKAGRAKKSSLSTQIASHREYLSKLVSTIYEGVAGEEVVKEVHSRKKAIIRAVQNLKKAHSIILDLRSNSGGDPYGVEFLCSLFIDETFPLTQVEKRKGAAVEIRQYRTLSRELLPLKMRLLEVPIYLLVGPKTFSAGEMFCNDMKALGRGVLVGELSAGAANPGEEYFLGNDFSVFIPWGRSLNPVDEESWEGRGVVPDHMTSAENALNQALLLIKE